MNSAEHERLQRWRREAACNDYNETRNCQSMFWWRIVQYTCCNDMAVFISAKRDHNMLIGFRRLSVLCVVYWWLKRHASSKPPVIVVNSTVIDRMVVGVSSTVVCRLNNSARTCWGQIRGSAVHGALRLTVADRTTDQDGDVLGW